MKKQGSENLTPPKSHNKWQRFPSDLPDSKAEWEIRELPIKQQYKISRLESYAFHQDFHFLFIFSKTSQDLLYIFIHEAEACWILIIF